VGCRPTCLSRLWRPATVDFGATLSLGSEDAIPLLFHPNQPNRISIANDGLGAPAIAQLLGRVPAFDFTHDNVRIIRFFGITASARRISEIVQR